MNNLNKKEYFIYFLGDVFFFVSSLWLALTIRHFSLPTTEFFILHLIPFSFLFLVWVFVFYVIGLYDKQTVVSRKKLPNKIINAQLVNGIIAVFFFYLSPYFEITPKTNLFLYLIVSLLLIFLWRLIAMRLFRLSRKQSVVVLSTGPELQEIAQELKNNDKYNIQDVFLINVDRDEIQKKIEQKVSTIIADFQNKEVQPLISFFYKSLFSGIVFIDAQRIYEDLFDKVPILITRKHWFLKNIYLQRTYYDVIKRFIDLIVALPLLIVSLIVYPFIFIAIKLDDKGSFFITQSRIGQNNRTIKVIKFRSMTTNDKGVWVKEKDNRITRVGSFLRKTRLDEIPQLWNVVKGDISLIGPRPDICGLREKLEKEIPYYNIRDFVRPGLSGWAQIKQDNPPQSIKETKERLMYDFYYIKNRSLVLDFKIALRTIYLLASRTGI